MTEKISIEESPASRIVEILACRTSASAGQAIVSDVYKRQLKSNAEDSTAYVKTLWGIGYKMEEK